MRLLCGLRQVDVSFCTGVSVSALASAEQGRKPLNHTEHGLIVAYLNSRWKFLQELERQQPGARDGVLAVATSEAGRVNAQAKKDLGRDMSPARKENHEPACEL